MNVHGLPRIVAAALTLLAATANHDAFAQADGAHPAIAFANSGAPAAQAPFGRGMTALHNFAFHTAADAFREAQTIDPDFALAYWGEAMTHAQLVWGTESLQGGRRALQKLETRASAVMTARERSYLAAAQALFGAGDREARGAAFEAKMRELHQAYPEDVEAAVFHASALIRRGPQQAEATLTMRLQAAAILEPLLPQHPGHPGVLHHLIHAYDDPVHARRALPAARRYEHVAMRSPHALHMPSHIYLRLGLWGDMTRANTAAYAASIDPNNRESDGPDLHALEWLHFAELQRGRLRAAEPLLMTMRSHRDAGNAAGGRAATRMAARAIGAEAAWDRARSPDESPYLDLFLSHANAILAAGLGASARRDHDGMTDALVRLDGLRRSAVNARLPQWAHRLTLMMTMIEADGLHQRGDVSGARAAFESTIDLTRDVSGDSTDSDQSLPNPIKPVRELYGEMLLGWGEAAAAQLQFEAVLQRNPRRPAALLGLARALAARGDRAAAACRYAELAMIWSAADAGLRGLEEAQRGARNARDCPEKPQ